MSILDMCGDEEFKIQVKDWNPNILSNIRKEKAYSASVNDQAMSPNSVISEGFEENRNLQISNKFLTHAGISGQGMFSADRFSPACHSSGSCAPLGRQFWSSGDYEVQQFVGPASHNNQNCLRVHPQFLHSNATSHKWVFGAIAELLDNAVDEICNGATFVKLDKIINPRSGSPALLIQDNGGGMDPESLREHHSHLVGYTKKISHSTTPLAVVPFPLPLSSGCNIRPIPVNPEFLTDTRRKSSQTLPGISAMGTLHSPKEAIPGQLGTKHNTSFIEGLTKKRGHEDFNAAREPLKRQAMMCSTREKAGEVKKGGQTNYKPELSNCERQCHVQQLKTMMVDNNKLRKECLEQEKIQEGLLLKYQNLVLELEQVKQRYDTISVELLCMDNTKVEKP
ncbi:Histidine kinase-, DNA gyrase B-, and HSP90-like ATPase [Musa troglodytarum]|uniref:Histidine kinase-, DNA gyrase B-, and HSP90-like ATPase n=1 Tax=Musa troglodytarum TaxID=320322 RepID=A0A9E7H7F5_9LILI|nr:Histidine kinase-, DNA gyrase B-, and HSP90-like ATPase [Musa troglodytarum]